MFLARLQTCTLSRPAAAHIAVKSVPFNFPWFEQVLVGKDVVSNRMLYSIVGRAFLMGKERDLLSANHACTPCGELLPGAGPKLFTNPACSLAIICELINIMET